MKNALIIVACFAMSCGTPSQSTNETKPAQDVAVTESRKMKLFLDVHNIGQGKVNFADVQGAHAKDLATQNKFGANFIKYWVDEKEGKVYCLAEALDSASISNTHKEAHGLMPDDLFVVEAGEEAGALSDRGLYLDVHTFGPGEVNLKAVADAHVKDLAVQSKFGVNLINYWVDEKAGVVMCLAEAKSADSLISTHKEAHGLIPKEVHQVKEGQ